VRFFSERLPLTLLSAMLLISAGLEAKDKNVRAADVPGTNNSDYGFFRSTASEGRSRNSPVSRP
jgi:hypothetical protein